jgi:Nitroreductase family
VRTYDPRPVPREVLERITNAAVVRAPSAGFSQGLRLVVVTDAATRKEIAVAAAEEELAAQGRPRWKADAPVHVVVLVREADYHARYLKADKLEITGGTEIEWPAPYWYVDAGAAVMALMFAAIDEGLATAIFGVTDVGGAEAHTRHPRRRPFRRGRDDGLSGSGRRLSSRGNERLQSAPQAALRSRPLGVLGQCQLTGRLVRRSKRIGE